MTYIVFYLLIGAAVGTLSGLLGIGGGILIVPSLTTAFTYFIQAPSIEIFHFAVGTSLSIVLVTSLAGALVHIRHRSVDWQLVRHLLPGLVVGVLLGATLTNHLPGYVLRVIFAAFLFMVSLRLFLSIEPKPDRQLPSRKMLFGFTLGMGTLSGLLGIGLGTLGVPFLIHHNVRIHKASATMVVCTVPVALCGSLSFMLADVPTASLSLTLGYIYLPALFFISLVSVICAPLGIRLAKKMRIDILQRIFAMFLIVVCLTLLI